MKHRKHRSIEDSIIAPIRSQKHSPPRILVVDDDRDIRRTSVDALVDSGYEVEAAEDGSAGWHAIRAHSYDLVITDNKMPKLTGIEMIEKVRGACMTIPVIMATGALPVVEFARKPWLTPDATLPRPCSNEDLVATVKKVLHRDANNDGREEAR